MEEAGFDHTAPPPTSGTETGASSSPPASPAARFYMTSDLRAATGLTRTHLDYYLREGLIVPTARTESGYLLFDENEVARVREIIAARQAGDSLKEIRERMQRPLDDRVAADERGGRR